MPSTERSFYLLNTRTVYVIFLYNCMQCIDGLVFYYNDMLQKLTMRRTQQFSMNFQLLFVTERTQLNATHAQLLEKLRPIAVAETCRFLAI